jgi:hypothetical protein
MSLGEDYRILRCVKIKRDSTKSIMRNSGTDRRYVSLLAVSLGLFILQYRYMIW